MAISRRDCAPDAKDGAVAIPLGDCALDAKDGAVAVVVPLGECALNAKDGVVSDRHIHKVNLKAPSLTGN